MAVAAAGVLSDSACGRVGVGEGGGGCLVEPIDVLIVFIT